MKTITFRPLRKIKKTGKIVVASYMQWRKVKTADYRNFNLVVDDEYKGVPSEEYVYDHEGEQLFWFTYAPDEVQIFDFLPLDIQQLSDVKVPKEPYGINWGSGGNINYNVKGMDCDGVPTFSHHTANYCALYKDINQFEPLTVGMVTKWLGWFLYQLENSYLQIGKSDNK